MDKILNTYTSIRNAIAKETKLITYALWDKDLTPCAIGALTSRENRLFLPTRPGVSGVKGAVHEQQHAIYDASIFDAIVNQNNHFNGTPEARRDYMLNYLDQKIVELTAVQGSDLPVPEFEPMEALLVI